MSSDYDKWARFDDEKCMAEMDREETESVKWISGPQHSNVTKGVEITQRNFEAVESKRAVELLKSSKRSRRNRVGNVSLETSSTVVSASLSDPIQEALRILISVTRNVDKLASLTEKKRLHFQGLDVVLTLVKDMETLDSIVSKNVLGSFADHKCVADFEDSKTTIFTQTFACGSLFALSAGHFAVAADFTRALIHVPGHDKECGYWILRALAFAGMGSPFLCHLHLKTAASVCSSFPGLQECIAYFDSDPTRLVRSRRSGYIEKEILRSAFFTIPEHNMHLTESPDLSRLFLSDLENLLDSDRFFSWCDRAFFQDSCLDALQTIFLRSNVTEGQPEEPSCFFSFAFFISHRLFLEGQLFYLEGHFATAESKYLAAANIVADCLRRFETTATLSTLVGKMRFFFSSICINLGMSSCRLQKFGRSHINNFVPNNNWRIPFPDRLLQWNDFEAMDWYRLSRDLCESPISMWRQLCVAIDQMWLEEALLFGDELEAFVLSKGDEKDRDCPCVVANYGHRSLSQAYLFGKQCNIQISCGQREQHDGQRSASAPEDSSNHTVVVNLCDSCAGCSSQLLSLSAVSKSDWMSLLENRRLLLRHLQLKTGK